MDGQLSARFFRTIKPFVIFLQLFGIDVNNPVASDPQWRVWITKLWTLFWLVLVFQAGLCIFVWRGLSALPHLFYSNDDDDDGGGHDHSRMEDLNDFIFGAYPLTFDALIYLALACSVTKTVRLLIDTLEPVDVQLSRPNLKLLRRYCIVGITWMSATIWLHFTFCVFSEICQPDDGDFNTWRLIQDLITIVNEMCTSCAVLVYVIFSRLLVVYYSTMAQYLLDRRLADVQKERHQFRDIVNVLRVLGRLQEASSLLHNRFGFILLAVCGLSIVSLVNSVYYMIRSVLGGDYVSPCWDLSFLAENVLRLVLVCKTSDRVRLAATKCFLAVEKLRDGLRGTMAPSERIKLTLYAIEGWQDSKKPPQLLGVLTLSSRLILQVVETSLAFIVFVTQFETAHRNYRPIEQIILCKISYGE